MDTQSQRYVDPVIEAYKKDVDRTLLRENLKLTVEERIKRHDELARLFDTLERAKDIEKHTAESTNPFVELNQALAMLRHALRNAGISADQAIALLEEEKRALRRDRGFAPQ